MHFTPDAQLVKVLFVTGYFLLRPGLSKHSVQGLQVFELAFTELGCGYHLDMCHPGAGRQHLKRARMQLLVEISAHGMKIQSNRLGSHGAVLDSLSMTGMITRKHTPSTPL